MKYLDWLAYSLNQLLDSSFLTHKSKNLLDFKQFNPGFFDKNYRAFHIVSFNLQSGPKIAQ
ncbi:MAG: hypothetical protein EA409_13605 [Saprospirales bacterium]|nr:MAG: hypothetical protein EA409_13605 [Saprospirales bacterium]